MLEPKKMPKRAPHQRRPAAEATRSFSACSEPSSGHYDIRTAIDMFYSDRVSNHRRAGKSEGWISALHTLASIVAR